MTENRKRIEVAIESGGKRATAAVTRGAASRTVTIEALPVRIIETPPYEGAYEVEPDFDGQVLPTRGLRMTDNLTVDAIPYSETSNPSGGITVYIGPDL